MTSETAVLGWATVGDMVLNTGYLATEPSITISCPGTKTLTISCPGTKEITLT